MTLYELKEEYKLLLELAEDPEVDPETLNDTMEAVDGEIEIKADNYAIMIKELEAETNKFDKEIERLTKSRAHMLAAVKRMKERLLVAMQETGKTKLPTKHFNLSIVKNGGVQPLKFIEGKEVPEQFLKYTPSSDTDKIRKALNAGEQLEFAYLGERDVHLNIK